MPYILLRNVFKASLSSPACADVGYVDDIDRESFRRAIAKSGDVIVSTLFDRRKLYLYDKNDPPAVVNNSCTIIRAGQQSQVWFPGSHSDVGGSYDDPILSDVTLEWMVRESTKYELMLPAMLPLVRRIPSIDDIHYQRKPSVRLTPRKKLSGWSTLPRRMIDSFFMHESTCKQLLSLTRGTNRTPITPSKPPWKRSMAAYVAMLKDVDEFTLALHLELCFKRGKRPLS
jgi:hypothetical protein